MVIFGVVDCLKFAVAADIYLVLACRCPAKWDESIVRFLYTGVCVSVRRVQDEELNGDDKNKADHGGYCATRRCGQL